MQFGRREEIESQPGVTALGYAGQLRLGAVSYAEFCEDPANAEAVAAQKGKSVLALYCQAYRATQKLEAAMKKEMIAFPKHAKAKTRATGNAAAPPGEREGGNQNFQLVPLRTRAEVQRFEPVNEARAQRLVLQYLEAVKSKHDQLPWQVRWLFALMFVFLPNLFVHITGSFARKFWNAATSEAATMASDTAAGFANTVNQISNSVDKEFETQTQTTLPEQSRGWLLPFLTFTMGLLLRKT